MPKCGHGHSNKNISDRCRFNFTPQDFTPRKKQADHSIALKQRSSIFLLFVKRQLM